MDKKAEIELTKGSEYRVYSLGGKEKMLETSGIFEGYITVGIDEIGLLIKLDQSHNELAEKTRIVPLHAVLAIDVLQVKQLDKKDEDREIPHYVG
jgi:hypothetical protein